jgi:hypothetical protein
MAEANNKKKKTPAFRRCGMFSRALLALALVFNFWKQARPTGPLLLAPRAKSHTKHSKRALKFTSKDPFNYGPLLEGELVVFLYIYIASYIAALARGMPGREHLA